MEQSQPWSRRKFIYTITGAGAVLLLKPFFSWAADDVDPRIATLVAKTIGIDAHNHVDVPLTALQQTNYTIDLAGEMKKSGLSAICMTFAIDYQKLTNPGEAYDRFINGLNAMDKVLEHNQMKRALNWSDLRSAHHKNIPTVIQSVEGAHFLEGQLDRLEVAYNRGVRHLGLLHDNDASVPLGDVFTNPPQWGGLTAFGADVIRACNTLGILVDLSHASNETIDAALKVSAKPVIISHTGLDTQVGQDEKVSNRMRPRLIRKEQAKMVADAGGVIGVWTHLADTPLQYAQNVRALVDVIGAEHVCIGTDTKMTPAYRANPQPDQSDERAGERTNGAWLDQKTGFYYAVIEALLKSGFTEEEISKIGGGNYCRVFDVATKLQ